MVDAKSDGGPRVRLVIRRGPAAPYGRLLGASGPDVEPAYAPSLNPDGTAEFPLTVDPALAATLSPAEAAEWIRAAHGRGETAWGTEEVGPATAPVTGIVPNTPGLLDGISAQFRTTRASVAETFPDGPDALAWVPEDAELFFVQVLSHALLVAHHGTEDREVWEVWDRDTWVQVELPPRPSRWTPAAG